MKRTKSSNLSIDQLTWFLAVVRHGSFAAAAREYGVHPSAVSRAVAEIETHIGVRLLQRTTRTSVLTEAGRAYATELQGLLAGLDNAARRARDTHDGSTWPVRATVPVSYACSALSRHLPDLIQAWPDVRVNWNVTDSRLDLVEDGLDFAIRLGSVADNHCVARRIRRVVYRVVASPNWVAKHGMPNAPDDLENHALTFPLHPHRPTTWHFRGPGDTSSEWRTSGPLSASNTALLCEATLRGAGVSVLPDWLIEESLENGSLVSMLDDYDVTLSDFEASVWLLLPTRRHVPKRVRAMCNWLCERLAHVSTTDET